MIPSERFELRLSDDEAATYQRDGFMTLQRITGDSEARWFREVYDRVLGERLRRRLSEGGPLGPLDNTLWVRLDRWETLALSQTALVRNASRVAARLLEVNEASLEVGLRFFFKPKNGGRPVPWHQDEAHHDPALEHRSLNVWVPFDAVNTDNGCLWYVPGSHLEGLREHRHPGGAAPAVALMTDDVPVERAVPAPLPLAGASFHHCRTLHCSRTNSSSGHRRALAIVCSVASSKLDRPSERPWFQNGYHVPEVSF
jgi:phytanoyl-CoA dioxygenase PhyH